MIFELFIEEVSDSHAIVWCLITTAIRGGTHWGCFLWSRVLKTHKLSTEHHSRLVGITEQVDPMPLRTVRCWQTTHRRLGCATGAPLVPPRQVAPLVPPRSQQIMRVVVPSVNCEIGPQDLRHERKQRLYDPAASPKPH